MSLSPMRISLSVKGVEVNLCLGNRKHRFFFTTRLRGWYLSASLRLGTGTNLPPSPTCLTKLLVAAANIVLSRRHRLRPSSNEPIFEEENQTPRRQTSPCVMLNPIAQTETLKHALTGSFTGVQFTTLPPFTNSGHE